MYSQLMIRGKPKNPMLVPGVHRFGRSKMYYKRAINIKKTLKAPANIEKKKPVRGETNGKTRIIQVEKSKRYHPTACRKGRRVKKRPQMVILPKPTQTRRGPRIRDSLTPGTVLIMLAGLNAGKRVILLTVLESGLLAVTGPFKINGVPLRRVHQQYVIATSTLLDISNVRLPCSFNDGYFGRDRKAARELRKRQKGDIFASNSRGYSIPDYRKRDQVDVDEQILRVVKESPEKKVLFKYLAAPFSLKSGQYPHNMKF